nr:Bacterial protein of uncharacterised function (DUF977) [Klebsiella pneumoniae]
MKKLGLSRATVQRYFSEAEATGEVVRHGRLGLFRDQRAVIDFDMKRFGPVPKVAVGMNYSLLGCPVFQRFLDIQEVILPVHLHRHPGRPYDNRKTHTGTVITRDGPKVKNCTRQSGCGSSAKRVLSQRNRAPSLCRKYAPPAAARHHQAYRGEACLNRTKRLFHRLRNISRVPAGVCSCRKPKRAGEKIALYIDDGCDAAVLNAAFAPALNSHTRESFFRASQSSCMRGPNDRANHSRHVLWLPHVLVR